jgi:entry exclusion lipoprotein TrbK
MKNIHLLSVVALAASVMAGCDNKPATPPIPVVNDKNCTLDNITKLDASIRTEFADACLRRGTFKPSSGKTW